MLRNPGTSKPWDCFWSSVSCSPWKYISLLSNLSAAEGSYTYPQSWHFQSSRLWPSLSYLCPLPTTCNGPIPPASLLVSSNPTVLCRPPKLLSRLVLWTLLPLSFEPLSSVPFWSARASHSQELLTPFSASTYHDTISTFLCLWGPPGT